ncbi:MMPL family transporter [Kribbella sandramycini]|uniref:MMPL family transporter n=1 Tax=Kribbella sandramycini TaxID=60450 RepID=A0A7Y4L7L3_9ACTN|nr:MMPL family transporter [Kribbella sandramycini]MBB6567068.1 RND superfamily putative drug exporter [Kribbella sandramycini]NOL44786.1 MMPL family transporter [Kribbella sandramycini]
MSVTSRRLALLVLLGALAVAAAVLMAPEPTPATPRSATGLSTDAGSAKAEQLRRQFADDQVSTALLVQSRTDRAVLGAADRQAVEAVRTAVRPLARDSAVPPPQYSEDGTVALTVVPLTAPDDAAVSKAVDELRAKSADAGSAGITVQVTGEAGFTTDLTRVFDGADRRLLIVTAAVVAVLLLVTYRSPALVAIPLAVVALTEQTTLKLAGLALSAAGLPGGGQVTGIASVLVFGAATDYALLLIARYREQLRTTEDHRMAVRQAVRRVFEPIFASGCTVIAALLILLLASTETLQGIAVACVVGVLLAMLSALLVLPAALNLAGRRVFWPFVPRVGDVAREGKLWGRLGAQVAKRPVVVLAASVAVLGVLSLGGLGVKTGLPQNEQFRVEPEAVRGAKVLAGAFPAGTTEPVVVVARSGAIREVSRVAQQTEGVASVRVTAGNAELSELTVVLDAEAGTAQSFATVERLRERVGAVPGADAAVGGEPAAKLDVREADARDRMVILPLILLLVGGVLTVLLRSLLAAALLVGTVVASFFAAFGISWLLSEQVFGFVALDGSVILLSFLFLVALGVDYNIFLTTRAREEARTAGTRDGMLSALTLTGGVITSAGILLAAVFAVLGVLPLITLTQVGIIVCTGVLLDTLLVRTVVVPALAFALGDRFWWPAKI